MGISRGLTSGRGFQNTDIAMPHELELPIPPESPSGYRVKRIVFGEVILVYRSRVTEARWKTNRMKVYRHHPEKVNSA